LPNELGNYIFKLPFLLSLRAPFYLSLRTPFYLSLRAEGVAIPVGHEIALLLPLLAMTKGMSLRAEGVAISVVCGIASSLPLLAMTKGMRHCKPHLNCCCEPIFTCHCEPKAWQSREKQNSKSNGKMTEQKSNNQHAKRGRVVAF